MAQRPLLKADRWAVLLGIPQDQQSLIEHYTLGRADLALVQTKTTSHNQLGLAIQIGIMRHLGRAWRPDDALPAALVSFVATQIDVDPAGIAEYRRRDATRREHALEVQRHLGLRAADRHDRRAVLAQAIATADITDKGQTLAEAIIAAFRERRLLLPAADTLDRLGRAARAIARTRMEAALLNGFTPEQLARLDALLIADPEIRLTRFAWLRSIPEAPSEKNLLSLLERLRFVRSFALDAQRRDRIHPDRWAQLVREGDVTPSWLTADFSTGRRRAMITAQLIELAGKLTDAAITMFNRMMARLFVQSKARDERRHLDRRQETARLIVLFRDTLQALAEAHESESDAFDVLDRKIGWDLLVKERPAVEAMAASADPDMLVVAGERYSDVHRGAAAFLEALTFRSARRNDPMLAALEQLRQVNSNGGRVLPDTVPMAHLRDKVRAIVLASGKPNRRLWEIATLAALRDRLRSGDIWAEGGRSFRPLAAQLMPAAIFEARKKANDLRLGVPNNAAAWLAQKRQEVDFRLKELAFRARAGTLPGVRLVDGMLTVSPPRAAKPKSADAVKWLCLERIPQINITDLLAEVNAWTGFSDSFTHLRTGDRIQVTPALLAAILGDATNLGAKRMADASTGLSERQIAWARLFHIRPETYKAALAVIINAHLAHPHASLWGAGRTSSSDGQFFRAVARGARRTEVNAHYGGDPGAKFYTWVSDQHGHFHILPMGATEDEAPYVLDGLYGHESRLDIEEHFVDTGGANDHLFGAFAIVGKRFAPRLRDIKSWRLHAFNGAGDYPAIEHHFGDRIDAACVSEGWDDALRIGASIEDRSVTPSTVLKKIAALPKSNLLSRALREIGRIERTLFMIEWYSNPALRDRCRGGLNKGESGNKLTRAVFFHERGEIRDGSFESQAFRASGLNLVVSAIILWNTVYLSLVVESLRAEGRDVPDHLLRHVSPQIWEHINLTGIYDWTSKPHPGGAYRPLRLQTKDIQLAA
jgi:TnpA family transposase